VLFLISPAWRDSRWCLAEFLLARQLGKTIFGVLVETVSLETLPKEITAEWQLCDLVAGARRQRFRVGHDPIVPETEISFAEVGLERLKLGLRRAGLDPSSFQWPPHSDVNRPPYPGLKALEFEDAAVFFGRDAAIVRALDMLRGMRERGIERIFVILGASGAGKSSFLRAGLLPRLKRDDRNFLPLPIIRPVRAVLNGATGLMASVEQAFRQQGASKTRAEIRKTLQAKGGLEQLLSEIHVLHCSRLGPDSVGATVLICIDQGEELFSAEGRAEAQDFLSLLSVTLALSPNEGMTVSKRQSAVAMIAIRTESYENLQTEPKLKGIAPQLFSLPPIERAEFKAVIEGPASRASRSGQRLKVEPTLTEQLLQDAEGADALPLLAFTLERLFIDYGSSGRLRIEDYEALGGVRGSIEAAVESAFTDPEQPPIVPTDKAERERLLRMGFIPWLARVYPQTEERKRRVARWDEIPEAAHPVLERLIRQRLLLRDRRQVEDGDAEVTVVEVAHEALLRQWPTLTTWLDIDADALKTVDSLQRAAGEWQKNARGAAWLVHSGDRLSGGETLVERPDFKRLLGADGLSYLRACKERDDRERAEREAQLKRIAQEQARVKEEQARTGRAQRRISGLLAAVALILLCGGVLIVSRSREVGRQISRVLAGAAGKANDEGRYTSGLRIAIMAARDGWLNPTTPEAEAEIARGAQSSVMIAEVRHGGAVDVASFSPDGRLVVTASEEDGTARVSDAQTGRTIFVMKLGDTVWGAAFSPDGRRVATVSGDNTQILRVWEVATGRIMAEAKDDSGTHSVDFSHDGRLLVSTESFGQTVWVRSAETLRPIAEASFEGPVNSAGLSPDARLVVAASEDKTARVWDALTGRSLIQMRHEAGIRSASFSPDGRRVVTGSDDKTARIWDVATGRMLVEVKHDDQVRSASFSPDGRRVVTATEGGSARVWDAVNGKTIAEVKQGKFVMTAVFSPDGHRVLTGSDDGIARVWDAATGKRVVELKHDDLVRSASFSPDGRRVLTSSDDGTARVWDSEAYKTLFEVRHGSFVSSVAYSPDGRRVVTASDNGLRVWDADTGKTITEVKDNSLVLSAAFSPDGRRVVTISGLPGQRPGHSTQVIGGPVDQSVRVWDAATGTMVFETKPATGSVDSAEFSPDGRRVVLADRGGTTCEWDAETGKRLAEVKEGDGSTESAIFSPDGHRIITSSSDGTARVLEAESGKTLVEMKHDGGINSAMQSFDGRRVVTASEDHTAKVWDATSGKKIVEMKHDASIRSVSFTSDGRHLLSVSDDGVARVWDAETGATLAEVRGDSVRSATFSSDGRRVVMTCCDSQTARVWDALTGKTLTEVKFDTIVTSVVFSPDGRRLAVASSDGIVRVLDISWTTKYGTALIRAVCSEKLNGAETLTGRDILIAPTLRGRQGENVCAQGASR
jgi:WD40 repeat protein